MHARTHPPSQIVIRNVNSSAGGLYGCMAMEEGGVQMSVTPVSYPFCSKLHVYLYHLFPYLLFVILTVFLLKIWLKKLIKIILELCPLFRGKCSTVQLCVHSIPIYSIYA